MFIWGLATLGPLTHRKFHTFHMPNLQQQQKHSQYKNIIFGPNSNFVDHYFHFLLDFDWVMMWRRKDHHNIYHLVEFIIDLWKSFCSERWIGFNGEKTIICITWQSSSAEEMIVSSFLFLHLLSPIFWLAIFFLKNFSIMLNHNQYLSSLGSFFSQFFLKIFRLITFNMILMVWSWNYGVNNVYLPKNPNKKSTNKLTKTSKEIFFFGSINQPTEYDRYDVEYFLLSEK